MPYTFDRYLNIRSALSPVLAPDGRHVSFLSDISGNVQAWRVGLGSDRAAQWPTQLTFFADKVWELHGTNAADHLLAVSDVAGNERQQFYLIVDIMAQDGTIAGHDLRRLTLNDDAIHRFGAWSQDGQAIVYASNERNGIDFDPYWMDVNTGETRRIAETSGNRTVVAWSPDDDAILMVDAVATEEIELYHMDVATGSERSLTAGHAAARYQAITWNQAGLLLLSDREHDRFALCRFNLANGTLETLVAADVLLADAAAGDGELDLLAVHADGSQAAVTLNVEGYSRVYLVDLATGDWRAVEGLPDGVITAISFSAGGEQLVCDLQHPQRNPDIWTIDLRGERGVASVQQRTFSNRAGVDARTWVAPERVQFTAFDGLSIPALFYRPQTAPPPAGFPCILYVHGGPASQQRPDFDVRFQYFLGQGYAILATNVRGSTGYGRRYMMLDDVEKRMDSVADLESAVDWLHGRAEIANDRIAIYGRSYGGFMVLAALTEYPHLFAAGIDVVGIADWVTFLERTSPWRRAHREREYGSLARHRDLLTRISPIHKAQRIHMPLMVLAGDNDPRVPLYESEQIVARVREAGGTVEFVHYADEGHRFSKLANRVDSFTRMADFLARAMG